MRVPHSPFAPGTMRTTTLLVLCFVVGILFYFVIRSFHTQIICGLKKFNIPFRYQPSTGYTWKFEPDDDEEDDDDVTKEDPVVAMLRLAKRNKRRKILDNRPAGERSAAEEEGIRAAEAMEGILVRLSKSDVVAAGGTARKSTTAVASAASVSSSVTTPMKVAATIKANK